ncbi:MAG: transporter substrate-binding domain-containing protein [Alphaproteobacteria bacterium]|nr:transporter substrate-binding domain-containing protein [Alphaproteobacteria bacterium]
MKLIQLIPLSALLLVLGSIGFILFDKPPTTPAGEGLLPGIILPLSPSPERETALSRALRTGFLRCGYEISPPALARDEGTGQLTGMAADIMEKITRGTGMKITWAREVTFSNWPAALRDGQVDAICTPLWPDESLAGLATFTTPLFYAALAPVVRHDDQRFRVDDLSRLNQDDVIFAVQEGHMDQRLARQYFPHARLLTLPSSISSDLFYQSVLTREADAVLTDVNRLYQLNRLNNGALRMIGMAHPVTWQPAQFAVASGETQLQAFFDQTIVRLQDSGELDAILSSWESQRGGITTRPPSPPEPAPED